MSMPPQTWAAPSFRSASCLTGCTRSRGESAARSWCTVNPGPAPRRPFALCSMRGSRTFGTSKAACWRGSGRLEGRLSAMPMDERRLPAILGPTAVGKTELSLTLAEQLDAEIISADSRQIYRPLTIGTAKPSPEELARVPHHFIDELELDEPFSAGRFAEAANARITEIIGRGRVPLIVGGSTLYLEALLHGLAEVPPTTEATRRWLMARLKVEGPERLFDELVSLDPSSAATMDPTKSQRIVRALEVYMDTGKPLSFYHEHKPRPPYRFTPVVLTRPRRSEERRVGNGCSARWWRELR